MSAQDCKRSMSHYRQVDLALHDAQFALNNFKELKPRMKVYNSYAGTKNLLTLDGTIPITYKGKVYNIPIIVWLLDTHPSERPMVQVQPTSTMTIKPSANVDPSGNVMVPYLAEWRQGSSDITSLLQILTVVFGEVPPVFSKAKNQVQTSSTPPPYPSYPGAMPQPYPPPASSSSYPYMSYPSTSTPYPAASTAASSFPTPYPPTSTNTPAYNPYGVNPAYPVSSYPSSSMPYPPATSSGYPPATSSGYPPYPAQQSPVTHKNPGAAPVSLATASTAGSNYQLSTEEIKRSLLSAVEDKMRRRIHDVVSTHKAEMDVLRNTQDNLLAGQAKLEEYENNLKSEMEECGTTISLLESKLPLLKAELSRRSQEEDCPPEEAIQTTTPLYRQLINSYAEEQAIEDAIYILGDSLRKEVISIELYLKKVRDLSRRQFMLRALMQKCREKAGLSDIYN